MAFAGCSTTAEPPSTTEQELAGQCTRNEATLRSTHADCSLDTDCPCGSFCDDIDHQCRFECMVPPGSPAESCATGTQCDDTGRCTAPGHAPPANAPALAANPAALTTVAGGAPSTLQVKLTMFTGGTALLAAATTAVRAAGSDGAEVSCDGGASFAHDCTLTAWSFAFDGAQYNAAKPLLARTLAGTALGAGQVHLRIDATDSDTVVPVSAAPAVSSASDGDYHGLITTFAVPAGIPVIAHVRFNKLIIEDPTRSLAPDGAFITSITGPGLPPSPGDWRVFWLEAPNAVHNPNSGIYADYQPTALNFTPATGALNATIFRHLLGAYTSFTLNATRDPGPAALCNTDADCSNGWTCPIDVRVCVPHSARDGGPTAFSFLDPRSQQWFDAIDDLIGNGTTVSGLARPELATTGADFIESLTCTTPQSGMGHLGVIQSHRGTEPSRSGDLACVLDDNTNSVTLAPGAIGLGTYYDRKGNAPARALLETCLADLARPVTSSFATAFASNVGDCVNLARTLPALRLLATGELNKQTSVNAFPYPDSRLTTLARRLVGKWGQLHGFIATTGLQERAYEDATVATPAQARAGLLSLLDVLDAGWAALLDARVEPVIANLVGTEDGSDDSLFWPEFDYRLAKKPAAYWTFNGGNAVDLVQGARLSTLRTRCDTFICPPVPTTCLPDPAQNSFTQNWSCPGLGAALPATSHVSDGGNLSVAFNVDPLDAEFPPYSGGTIIATSTLAVFESWDSGGQWLNFAHPTASGTPQIVSVRTGLLGYWTGGTTGGLGPTFGTSVAVVRNALAKTYTAYVFDPNRNGGQVQTFTVAYSQPVSGALPSVGANRVLVGAGPFGVVSTSWWGGTPSRRSSYAAHIDDVALWSSMISKHEFERFARVRAFNETTRAIYPMDMVINDYGTQEIKTPVATDLLNAQIAHLELADRLAVHMRYEAQAACDSNDPTARADVNMIIARLGRTLRQSAAVQAMTIMGDADTSNADRVLLGAKTSQLTRDLTTLTACRNPYGMADHEVPLYFGSIAPAADEKAAFFAASDHLLTLAEQRNATAQTALDAVRTRWDQARQSDIAQLQDDTARATRVDELATKYGEGLIRLCGISDRTPEQIVADINAGTFALDTCFIKPPQGTTCPTSNTTGPVMDADPSCYRGALGGALVDTRTAYYAQQAAYQAWQAAVGNSQAAEQLCVLKEMDVFGCSALDRHALSGVTCPPGHEGTIQLTNEYLHAMIEAEAEKSWFDNMLHTAATIVAVAAAAVTTGPGAAFVAAAIGAMGPLSTEMGNSMEDRKRAHEAMLQQRSMIEDVRACWNTAEQYERAIAAAEQASQEATSRMQAAVIAFENGLAEGREIMAVAPQEIDRELNRPAIPIAFHYWLPEALETYHLAYESARRYAYMALRATEYDMLDSYATPQTGKPSRAAVLGAWLPPALANQLAMMRDQTNTRETLAGPPRLGHMTFDLGAKFFGLDESSPDFGAKLLQYAEPVYSQHGEYLGMGVRFSLVPSADDEAPTWRCAERIWRVNLGATGFPTASDGTHVKLLKRNVFASRKCGTDGFAVATLRPGTNLLVGAGDAAAYVPENTNSVADVALMDFNQPDALFNFKTRDDFLNGSSSELALQELYGDYVLLFPSNTLAAGLDLSQLRDFFMRFDFLSIDNTPPISAVFAKRAANTSSSIVISKDGAR